MSDEVLSPSKLDSLLHRWNKKYGEEKVNSAKNTYWEIPDSVRRHAFSSLIKTLRKVGCDREYIESKVLENKIQAIVAPEGVNGAKENKAWRDIMRKAWTTEILEEFDKELDIEIEEGREVSELEYSPRAKKEDYKSETFQIDPDKLQNPVPKPTYIIDNDLEKLLNEGNKDE